MLVIDSTVWTCSLRVGACPQAVPFYGYASNYKLFVKLHVYDPSKVSRLCNLLGSGAIHNRFPSQAPLCLWCLARCVALRQEGGA